MLRWGSSLKGRFIDQGCCGRTFSAPHLLILMLFRHQCCADNDDDDDDDYGDDDDADDDAGDPYSNAVQTLISCSLFTYP